MRFLESKKSDLAEDLIYITKKHPNGAFLKMVRVAMRMAK